MLKTSQTQNVEHCPWNMVYTCKTIYACIFGNTCGGQHASCHRKKNNGWKPKIELLGRWYCFFFCGNWILLLSAIGLAMFCLLFAKKQLIAVSVGQYLYIYIYTHRHLQFNTSLPVFGVSILVGHDLTFLFCFPQSSYTLKSFSWHCRFMCCKKASLMYLILAYTPED